MYENWTESELRNELDAITKLLVVNETQEDTLVNLIQTFMRDNRLELTDHNGNLIPLFVQLDTTLNTLNLNESDDYEVYYN